MPGVSEETISAKLIEADKLFRTGDYVAALEAYNAALISPSLNLFGLVNRAVVHQLLGMSPYALTDCHLAIALADDDIPLRAIAYLNRGVFYALAGAAFSETARRDFGAALSLWPECAAASSNLNFIGEGVADPAALAAAAGGATGVKPFSLEIMVIGNDGNVVQFPLQTLQEKLRTPDSPAGPSTPPGCASATSTPLTRAAPSPAASADTSNMKAACARGLFAELPMQSPGQRPSTPDHLTPEEEAELRAHMGLPPVPLAPRGTPG